MSRFYYAMILSREDDSDISYLTPEQTSILKNVSFIEIYSQMDMDSLSFDEVVKRSKTLDETLEVPQEYKLPKKNKRFERV